MTVTLINNSGRIKVFTLTHDHYCKALGWCECAGNIPGSLTIPAGARVTGLPKEVLEVPQIQKAIRARDILARRYATRKIKKIKT